MLKYYYCSSNPCEVNSFALPPFRIVRFPPISEKACFPHRRHQAPFPVLLEAVHKFPSLVCRRRQVPFFPLILGATPHGGAPDLSFTAAGVTLFYGLRFLRCRLWLLFTLHCIPFSPRPLGGRLVYVSRGSPCPDGSFLGISSACIVYLAPGFDFHSPEPNVSSLALPLEPPLTLPLIKILSSLWP